MIEFHFKSDLRIEDKTHYSDWISSILASEGFSLGPLNYIFVDDKELLGINVQYLGHDTLTDIISFDYTQGKTVSGDIFISTDRVRENAQTYGVDFANELLRVMSHGLLHFMGYGDKTEEDRQIMRAKEEEKMEMFHVEH